MTTKDVNNTGVTGADIPANAGSSIDSFVADSNSSDHSMNNSLKFPWTAPLRLLRMPKWIFGLLFALALSAAFAFLGQWQLGRAVEAAAPVATTSSENPQPLTEIVKPDSPISSSASGHMVTFSATMIPGDTLIIPNRISGDRNGYWVVLHTEVENLADVSETSSTGIPVAVGWAQSRAAAEAAARCYADTNPGGLMRIVGRFVPSEGPLVPTAGKDADLPQTLSVAELIGRWANYDNKPVYNGYVITTPKPACEIEAITTMRPVTESGLNWLNIFYSAEWALFAGFAIFFWYRLVRDAYQRELEDAAAAGHGRLEA